VRIVSPKAGEEDDLPLTADAWWPGAPCVAVPEVDYEPPEFVGSILGPDGESLRDVFVQPPVPFGFQPSTTW
jgi:hypothetical protein